MKLDALDAAFVMAVTAGAMVSPWLALAVGSAFLIVLVFLDYRAGAPTPPAEGTPE